MYAQRVPQQHRLPLRLSLTYWVRHRKKLDHCRERWLRGQASALAARIRRGLAVLIVALITAVLLSPIPARAIDSVQVSGDLEMLVNAGKMFKIVIDSKTGKTVFGSEKQFHRDLATDNGIPENRYLGGLIRRNAEGSWTIELFPKNKFPQWQSEAYVQKYFNLLQADPVGQHLVNPGTLPKLTVKVNERPMTVYSRAGIATATPSPPTPGAAKPTRQKELLGVQRMVELSTAPVSEGGLGWRTAYDLTESKIANFGQEGGTGADWLFVFQDPKNPRRFIFVTDESKYGQSRLKEFDIYDATGKPTGKKDKFLQGSIEWFQNYINRLNGGNDFDRRMADVLSTALDEGRIWSGLFRTRAGGRSGDFEAGPIQYAATTPGKSFPGLAGTWELNKEGEARINKMKFGQVGCSDCNIGSRLAKEAAKSLIRKDPRYAPLANANDNNVNPYFLVPSDEALGDEFVQERTTAWAEADELKKALPPDSKDLLVAKVTERAKAHVEAEKAKSLVDRQDFWSTLTDEGQLKIQRQRSLYDALKDDTPIDVPTAGPRLTKGDAKTLAILQKAMHLGVFGQLAWSLHQGGSEGLKYALGEMAMEEIQEELVQQVALWYLRQAVASEGALLSGAAQRVIPLIETGQLGAVMWVASISYGLSNWLTTSALEWIYGEEYAAESRKLARYFIQYVNSTDYRGARIVNFVNLCEIYEDPQDLSAKLDFYENQTMVRAGADPSNVVGWRKARESLEQAVSECRIREVLKLFFDTHNFTPGDFCQKMTSVQMRAALSDLQKEHGTTTWIDDAYSGQVKVYRQSVYYGRSWETILQLAADLHERCSNALDARMALSARLTLKVPDDLRELEEKSSTVPDPTVFLLADTTAQEERSAKAGEKVSIATTAVLWGLPNTRNITIRLRSYLQDARGGQWPLRDESTAFEFDKEAYTPAELSRFMPLQDDFTLDPQLPEGPATYTVELYRGIKLIEARRVLINREDAASAAATPSTQAGNMVTWVRKGPFFSSNGRCLPDKEPSPDIKKCGPQDKQAQISGTTMTLTSDRTGRSNSLEWKVEAPATLKAGDEIKLTLTASRDYEGPVVGGWWNIEGESEGQGDKSAGSAKNYRLSGSPDPHSATYTFKFDPGFGDPYVQLSAGNDFSPELWVLVTYMFEKQPAK